VGSRRDCMWILGLSGFRVVRMDESVSGRLVIRIQRRGVRRYTGSVCGRRTGTRKVSKEAQSKATQATTTPSLKPLGCPRCVGFSARS
jgi:hypothetical protein